MNLLKFSWRRFFIVILLILIMIPLIMFLVWRCSAGRELNMLTIDKTSLTQAARERYSLFWVLHHNKFLNFGNLPSVNEDYYGFFPHNKKQYEIRDLDSLAADSIQALANKYNILYIADTYGIYASDWYKNSSIDNPEKILYGGLNHSDFELMQEMQTQKKTIVLEFNSIIPPTTYNVRKNISESFGVHWTGWRGRYFKSLDTNKTALSKVIIKRYLKNHNGHWPYEKAGIVLLNNSKGTVI